MGRYFKTWVTVSSSRSRSSELESQPADYDFYMGCIEDEAGLRELARTPFVLRVMASALPKLATRLRSRTARRSVEDHTTAKVTPHHSGTQPAQKASTASPGVGTSSSSLLTRTPTATTTAAASSSTATRMKASRSEIYEVYVTMGWEAAKERLTRNWPLGLPDNFDELESFDNYSMDLAVEMLARNQLAVESPTDVYMPGGPESSPWIRFFRNEVVTRTSRSGAGLVRKQGMAEIALLCACCACASLKYRCVDWKMPRGVTRSFQGCQSRLLLLCPSIARDVLAVHADRPLGEQPAHVLVPAQEPARVPGGAVSVARHHRHHDHVDATAAGCQ